MKVTVDSLQNDTLQNKFEYENWQLLYRVLKRKQSHGNACLLVNFKKRSLYWPLLFVHKHIRRSTLRNNTLKMSRGHAVAQLVEALRHKSEGRGFDSRWCHCNFSLTYSFRPHYGPGVDSGIYHGGKGGRCVGLITFMCRMSWNLGASTSWNPQGLPRPVMAIALPFYFNPCPADVENMVSS
jgi:hypothetical protein